MKADLSLVLWADRDIHFHDEATRMVEKDRVTRQKQEERHIAVQAVDQRIGLPVKYALVPFTLLAVSALEPEKLTHTPFYIGFGLFVGGTVLLTYLYRRMLKPIFLLVLISVWVEELYLGLLATSTGAATVAPLVVLSAVPILKASLVSVSLREYLVIALSATAVFLGAIAALAFVYFSQSYFWWAFLGSGVITATGQVVLDSLMKQRAERLVLERQRELLLRRIIDAQEEERKRIARELHDETGQALAALMVNLQTAEAMLSKAPVVIEEVRTQLAQTRAFTSETYDAVHKLAFDLRPSLLDDLGLIPALRAYAKRHLEPEGICVNYQSKGFDRRLHPNLEVILFRVLQEALTNVTKHARAQVVDIWLTCRDGRVTAGVQDDGQGFDMKHVLATGQKEDYLGLTGMKERVAIAGGDFSITSQRGEGTRVVLEIPIAKETANNAED